MSSPNKAQDVALLKRTNSELKLAVRYFIEAVKGNETLKEQLDDISTALKNNEVTFTFASMVEQFAKMKQNLELTDLKNKQKNIATLKKEVKEALTKRLSSPQLKALEALLTELSGNEESTTLLKVIGNTLTFFVDDFDHLRASSKVITKSQEGQNKDSTVVAADISIASKKLIKDVLSINTELTTTYPNEVSIQEILKDASAIDSSNGNFFLALSLLERTTRQLTLFIQRERCIAEEMLGDIHTNLVDAYKQTTIIEKLMASSGENSSAISKSMLTKLKNMEIKGKSIDSIAEMKVHIKDSVSMMSNVMNIYAQEQNKVNQANENAIKKLSTQVEKSTSIAAKLESKLSTSEEENLLDPMTKTGNRKGYVKKVKHARDEWLAQKTPLSMMVIDIDKFKTINDKYGHSTGDVVIKTLGNALKKSIRNNDYVARYGGEEFVIILPKADIPTAVKIARKIRKVINELKFENKKKTVVFQITCSIGISEFTEINNTSLDVFELADKAMYKVKDNGRDGIAAIKDNKVIGAVTQAH